MGWRKTTPQPPGLLDPDPAADPDARSIFNEGRFIRTHIAAQVGQLGSHLTMLGIYNDQLVEQAHRLGLLNARLDRLTDIMGQQNDGLLALLAAVERLSEPVAPLVDELVWEKDTTDAPA